MSGNFLLIVLVTGLPIIHYLLVGSKRGIFNVDGIFVLAHWLMTVGTLWLLDLSAEVDRQYAAVMVAPFVIYVLTSVLLHLSASSNSKAVFHRALSVRPVAPQCRMTLRMLYLIAVAVTLAYFSAVGYNVLALGLSGLVTGEGGDYTSLRLDSYASSRYLFPGYVNQFKNVLLPALTVVLIHSLYHGKYTFRRPLTTLLATICVFALLGTGQRGAFVLFLLATVVFVYHLDPQRFRRRLFRVLALALPPFFIMTLFLGRSSAELSAAGGPIAKTSVLVQEIGKRFFYDNQWSGYMAYQYVVVNPVQWGREWLEGILGFLPGHPGSSLAREVFAHLYGTDRGTAPISLWGSVYHNFEWFGLLIVPVLLAVVAERVSRRMHAKPNVNSLELMGAAGAAATAGSWVAGGPGYLLNSGVVAYAMLWWLGTILRPHASDVVASAPSDGQSRGALST